MGTQEGSARSGVKPGDVLAVLALAREHVDATTPVPASWEAVLAQVRAVLVVQAAPPLSTGTASQASAPGSDAGQHENPGYS